VALFSLIVLTRPFNSATDNINFSYGLYAGTEQIFSSYLSFMWSCLERSSEFFAVLQWIFAEIGLRPMLISMS